MLAAGFTDNYSFSFQTILDFFRTGGWFIAPIVICWFISITVIIWKGLDLRRKRIIPQELAAEMEGVDGILRQGKFPALQTRLREDSSLLAQLARVAISSRHGSFEAASRATETAAREEVSRLERGIPVLEIIFTIAPMLGLIGTVSGLVRIFSSLGSSTAQTAAQAREIAHGIAEAMNTTIAGLVVAVPALIAQVLYSRHVERLALRLSSLLTDFLDTCWNHVPAGESTTPPAPPEKVLRR